MGLIGPDAKPIYSSTGATAIPIAGEVVVYSRSFRLQSGEYFAVSYKAASGGNVKLKIELEQGYKPPSTEGSSDSTWAVGEDQTAIESALADTTQHHKKLTPIPVGYARLKITGLADPSGNAATTTLTAFLSKQEQL